MTQEYFVSVETDKLTDVDETYRNERLSLPWFFVLLFSCAIGVLPMILASHGKQIPEPLKLLQLLMLFGPALVACLASYVNGGWKLVKDLLRMLFRWRVHPGWYFLALAVPPLTYAFSLALSNAFGFTNITMPGISKILNGFFVTLGVYFLLNTEELAWRGYALPRMRARFGIVWATIVIGILWAVIHLPLFWLKGGHPAGYSFWGFAIRLLCMNFLFTVAFYGPSRSVLIPHLLHQALNAAVEAIPVYPKVALSGVPMTVAAVVFTAIGVILLLRMIRRNPELNRPAPAMVS